MRRIQATMEDFRARIAVHVMLGDTPEQARQAVLDEDHRLALRIARTRPGGGSTGSTGRQTIAVPNSGLTIRVDFTMTVPAEHLPRLLELAAAATPADARRFVQSEAEENILSYLEDNGVPPVSNRGAARPADQVPRSTR